MATAGGADEQHSQEFVERLSGQVPALSGFVSGLSRQAALKGERFTRVLAWARPRWR